MKKLLLIIPLCISCSSLTQMVKKLAGSNKTETSTAAKTTPQNMYSSNKNFQLRPLPERRYGRMNRDRFEKEAKVGEDAGSLWVSEGQSSYLFSQNQKRLEGDVLSISLEEQAKDQLNSKVKTIAGLLKRRKELAAQKRSLASAKDQGKASDTVEKTEKKVAPKTAANKEEEIPGLGMEKVPSRVVASYPDGSYRIKGTKSFLIENKEFQVLITGLVRGNDIKDDSIASSKLLDAKFDVVSERRVR